MTQDRKSEEYLPRKRQILIQGQMNEDDDEYTHFFPKDHRRAHIFEDEVFDSDVMKMFVVRSATNFPATDRQ